MDSAPSGETTEQTVARLARLSPLDYERVRESEASRLGIRRVMALDAEVKKARPRTGDDVYGGELMFPECEPWPTPVDGAELLEELARTARTFVVLPPPTPTGRSPCGSRSPT